MSPVRVLLWICILGAKKIREIHDQVHMHVQRPERRVSIEEVLCLDYCQ